MTELTVHCGAHQIGGTEITCGGAAFTYPHGDHYGLYKKSSGGRTHVYRPHSKREFEDPCLPTGLEYTFNPIAAHVARAQEDLLKQWVLVKPGEALKPLIPETDGIIFQFLISSQEERIKRQEVQEPLLT